ncbi:MAG: PP2C family protein-serine/threonine phosphatase [Thermoanaerobaculia bacterium]
MPPSEHACAICHDPIEPGLQLLHPSVTVCLACLSVEERRRLESDLQSAAQAQRALLPPLQVQHDGWQIAYTWMPAGAVSGDHVDLLRPARETDPLHLLLGDVAGKGVAAALLQSRLHAIFRAVASPDVELTALLARTNELLAESTLAASYATLVALRLHADGRVELGNAGHPLPLLADRRGVRPVEGSDLPLGLFPDASFTRRELDLAPGSTLLLFTDGLTEAEAGGEEFGIGRAAAALRRAAALPPTELLASMRADLQFWLKGAPRGDDLTIVAIRRAE